MKKKLERREEGGVRINRRGEREDGREKGRKGGGEKEGGEREGGERRR